MDALRAAAAVVLLAGGASGCRHKVIEYGEINVHAARKILAATMKLRGLAPLRPIHFALITPGSLRATVQSELADEERRGTFVRAQKAFPLLGLLHPDVDVRSVFERLYTGETLGFYDSARDVMRLVPREVMRTEIVEIIAAVRGRDHIYGEALAHELTHALVDQHHDLDALLGGDHRSDLDLALRALAEGDASRVGHAYGGVVFSDPKKLVKFIKRRLPSMYEGKGIPRYYRESFVMPYLDGLVFVDELYQATKSWALVDRAYDDPPVSTEMILHPERYISPARDLPRDAPVEASAAVLGSGWKAIYEDELGELGTREALAPWIGNEEGEAAAAGWDGDRARVYEGPRNKLALVWRSIWDDDTQAAEFADAFNKALGKRRSSVGPMPGGVFLRKDEVVVVLGDWPIAPARVAEAVWAPPPASAPASAPAAAIGTGGGTVTAMHAWR